MRISAWLLVVVALVSAAEAAQTGAAGKDLASLQGTWRLVGREVEGKKATAAEVKDAEALYLVKGDRLVYRSQGKDVWEATIKLNARATPRTLEVTHISGPFKGKSVRGIYKLEGQRLTICFSTSRLPTEFSTSDTDRVLLVYQRARK
jgi:uncharacterized protein (TIGR03067 family)